MYIGIEASAVYVLVCVEGCAYARRRAVAGILAHEAFSRLCSVYTWLQIRHPVQRHKRFVAGVALVLQQLGMGKHSASSPHGQQDPETPGGCFGFLRAMLIPDAEGGELDGARSDQIGAYYGHDNDIVKIVARDRFCVEASCDKICAHNMKVSLCVAACLARRCRFDACTRKCVLFAL